jgi:hypothetical protein
VMRIAVDVIVLAMAVAWMIRQGFSKCPGRFLTWPMYNKVLFYRVRLVSDQDGSTVNPWDDMIFIDYGGGAESLREYLAYLKDIRGITVSGDGVLADGTGYHKVTIGASNVDIG